MLLLAVEQDIFPSARLFNKVPNELSRESSHEWIHLQVRVKLVAAYTVIIV